jgi:voltage-gated potassium channel
LRKVTLLAVAENRWRWLREHPLEVAVVVLTPPLLPPSLQSLRVLRLLRLVRLLRLAQIIRRVFTFEGVRYAALLALVTAVGGGTAFASVEKEPSAWDGIWRAVTATTTVGCGDITPQTDTAASLPSS